FSGGLFTGSGEAETSSLSKFNGERWFNIGAGVQIGDDPGELRSMVAWDHDLDGVPWLFVGGMFDTVPGAGNAFGAPYTNIAGWDPVNAVWDFDFNRDAFAPSPSLIGPDGPIYAMLPFDDTPDDDSDPLVLIVGGDFTSVNGGATPAANIAKLRFVPGVFGGGSWQWEAFAEPGGPTSGPVRALTIWDPPSYAQGEDDIDLEPQLIVGGEFNQGIISYGLSDGDMPMIAWGNVPFDRGVDGAVYSLAVWDPPAESDEFDSDPALAVGGEFTDRGSNIAYFGNNIEVVGEDETDVLDWFPIGTGTNGPVYAVEALTPPAGFQFAFGTEGQLLYLGGDFSQAGGGAANNIAMWHHTDQAITQVGWGVDGPVYAIELIADEEERFAYGNPDYETFPW
ncbi:MAG: hypothetical protein KDA28_08355, partial [Phycisphaerales bacterium]|nr:hypothetical protein [Phycisphaerales bacterium]